MTARALAPLAVIAEYAAPLLREGGVLVAWKGSRDDEEEERGAAAAEQLGLSAPEVLRVEPFEGAANRHLHVLKKVGPTPDGFPATGRDGAQAPAEVARSRKELRRSAPNHRS